MDDWAAERAFGGVVGRLDGGVGRERPQCGPDFEQVVGEAPVVLGAGTFAAGVFEQLPELVLDGRQLDQQSDAVVMIVLVGAPGGEHAAGQLEALLAEGLLVGQALLAVAGEVALEVAPADLAALGVQVLIAGPAIRDHDSRVVAGQRLELLAVAVLGNLKQRRFRVVSPHNARESPAVRQPVSSTCSAAWAPMKSRRSAYCSASASLARWQIASTLPGDTPAPNSSLASSLASRREIRLRAVSVTSAAAT